MNNIRPLTNALLGALLPVAWCGPSAAAGMQAGSGPGGMRSPDGVPIIQVYEDPQRPPANLEVVMNGELDVIVEMGFPGYFLIVQDFINEAKRRGIRVGPGRGSGAGSLVAYEFERPGRYEFTVVGEGGPEYGASQVLEVR